MVCGISDFFEKILTHKLTTKWTRAALSEMVIEQCLQKILVPLKKPSYLANFQFFWQTLNDISIDLLELIDCCDELIDINAGSLCLCSKFTISALVHQNPVDFILLKYNWSENHVDNFQPEKLWPKKLTQKMMQSKNFNPKNFDSKN